MTRKPANSPDSQTRQEPVAGSKAAADPSCQGPDTGENLNYETEQDDPVWDLLDKASSREPSAFFARNVIRETRLLENSSDSLAARILATFTPTRLALGAAACACAMAAYQFWPTTPDPVITSNPVANDAQAEHTTALAELVIEESLNAAAEDPSIFTRDEVVAMIGF